MIYNPSLLSDLGNNFAIISCTNTITLKWVFKKNEYDFSHKNMNVVYFTWICFFSFILFFFLQTPQQTIYKSAHLFLFHMLPSLCP